MSCANARVDVAPGPTSSDALLAPVKLRLIAEAVSTSHPAHQQRLCFNDTLEDGMSFEAWRQRVEKKLSSHSALVFGYSFPPSQPLPLGCDEDLVNLRRSFREALDQQQGVVSKTFRCVVTATGGRAASSKGQKLCDGSDVSGGSVVGVSTRSTRSKLESLRLSALESSSNDPNGRQQQLTGTVPVDQVVHQKQPPPVLTGGPERAQREDFAGASPEHKRQRPSRRSPMAPLPLQTSASTNIAPTPAVAVDTHQLLQQQEDSEVASADGINWDQVLRSIVKTVDRHHFGSKLLGASSNASL